MKTRWRFRLVTANVFASVFLYFYIGYRMENCLIDISKSITLDIIKNVISAFTITIIFFILKEWIFKIPKFHGKIYLKQTTLKTKYNPYQDMELQYLMNIRIEGLNIIGTAEKIYEDSSIGMKKEHIIHYNGKNRSYCQIEGYIQKRYISFHDKVIFHSFEENEQRKSSTYYQIEIRKKYLIFGEYVFKNGSFQSTIAEQEGKFEISLDGFSQKNATNFKNIENDYEI